MSTNITFMVVMLLYISSVSISQNKNQTRMSVNSCNESKKKRGIKQRQKKWNSKIK